MTLMRRKKRRTLAQIKRNPPPGAKGYRRPDETLKRKPVADSEPDFSVPALPLDCEGGEP